MKNRAAGLSALLFFFAACSPLSLRSVAVPAAPAYFHPGKTAIVTLDGVELGYAGCIDPRVARAAGLEANAYCVVLDAGALPAYETPRYRPPSRFPATYRDLALVVDVGVAASELERAIADAAGPLSTGVSVFDEYRGPQVGEGRKSLAVRITLARFDTTITDAQADAAIEQVLDAVRKRFDATIRT